LKTIEIMFEHLNWSNRQILKVLQTYEGVNQQTIRLFSHILLAEHVWFTRLKGLDSSSLPIWDDVSLEDCSRLCNENQKHYNEFLTQISDDNLEHIIHYRNSSGKEFQNTLREILTHVALHGQYHRGQINLQLRGAGFDPKPIDFIFFRR